MEAPEDPPGPIEHRVLGSALQQRDLGTTTLATAQPRLSKNLSDININIIYYNKEQSSSVKKIYLSYITLNCQKYTHFSLLFNNKKKKPRSRQKKTHATY